MQQARLSSETRQKYLEDVRGHLDWLVTRGIEPAHLCEQQVQEYGALLLKQYRPATVHRKFTSLRRFYEAALAQGVMAFNPARHLKVPKGETREFSRLSDADKWRLLNSPAGDSQKGRRDRAILTLMALHGVREVEVSGILLADLNLAGEGWGTVRIVGKRNQECVIHLCRASHDALKGWMTVRGLMKGNSPWLFITLCANTRRAQRGAQIGTRGIRKMIDGYLNQSGLKRQGLCGRALSRPKLADFLGADTQPILAEALESIEQLASAQATSTPSRAEMQTLLKRIRQTARQALTRTENSNGVPSALDSIGKPIV
jgi:integrase/recombinase XerD